MARTKKNKVRHKNLSIHVQTWRLLKRLAVLEELHLTKLVDKIAKEYMNKHYKEQLESFKNHL